MSKYIEKHNKSLNISENSTSNGSYNNNFKKIAATAAIGFITKTVITYALASTPAAPLIPAFKIATSIYSGSSVADGVVSAFGI